MTNNQKGQITKRQQDDNKLYNKQNQYKSVQQSILIQKQVRNIVAKNIMNESFKPLRYSLIYLLFLPGITNIYYTFRPHSPWKTIMMIGVPLGCILNTIVQYRKGIINFSDQNSEDANIIRNKFIKHNFIKYNLEGKKLEPVIENHLAKGYKYSTQEEKSKK